MEEISKLFQDIDIYEFDDIEEITRGIRIPIYTIGYNADIDVLEEVSNILKDCEKKYDQELDKDEIVKYMTFNYDELFELEKMGYINGANTKLALEKSHNKTFCYTAVGKKIVNG